MKIQVTKIKCDGCGIEQQEISKMGVISFDAGNYHLCKDCIFDIFPSVYSSCKGVDLNRLKEIVDTNTNIQMRKNNISYY